MSEEFLTLYNRELDAVRRLAAEFAEAHPKVAGRLRLTADAIEDPHVERLVEAVAFMNARVKLRLEDDFPELTAGLLDTLYPHYLAPIPSFATVQFQPVPDLEGSHEIASGTEIETEAVNGESCRFRTCHPVTLWPITIEAVALAGRPLTAPPNPAAAGAAACLRISLKVAAPDKTFASLGIKSLRFFLRGAPAFPLYELIFNHTLSVALAESPNDRNPVILDPACLKSVGFEADEALLPYPKRTLSAYGLLTEYFAFPEKHEYFTVEGIDTHRTAGGKLDLIDDPGKSRYLAPRKVNSGGGGLVSTASDYLRFCKFMLNKGELDGVRLLGRKTVELMTMNHLKGDMADMGTPRFSESTYTGIGFGLGFSVMIDPAKAFIAGTPGEFAWGGAASTAFWIDPKEDMAVVLLTQLMPSSTYPIRRELRVLTYQAIID